jgi:hypothetical protein
VVPGLITPEYLRERAAHFHTLADEAETTAKTLRKVAQAFLAEADLEEAARRIPDKKGC